MHFFVYIASYIALVGNIVVLKENLSVQPRWNNGLTIVISEY